ncbi:spermine oxidase [Nasonia vitripennis]|uniref:Amine oxidase domain-containing protein n=1 Tax=Nasonia vitripennis TaxID=7425 RepID=A0A7M7QIV6_NASVI|nr:spermine oxidase [Nasonia vitripennis]
MKENMFMLHLVILMMICNNLATSSEVDKFTKKKEPKIIVVGAGSSGIAAASKLFENGFKNVTILEAESHYDISDTKDTRIIQYFIALPVCFVSLGNYSVDLGGQWVKGEEGNAVFKLAQPLDLIDKSDEPDYGLVQEYIDSLGNPLSEEVVKNISDFSSNYIYETDFFNGSVFDERFSNIPEVFLEKKKYLQYLELFTISFSSADSWRDVSLFNNDRFRVFPGDHIINWKDDGYSKVFDLLTKRFPNPEEELPVLNNTILNSEVTKIDYSKNNTESPISINTFNGISYQADHVIVTVSLGVLKNQYETLFNPLLPEYKQKAIKGLGFGNIAKIYLLFDEPFWNLGNRRVLHLSFVWNEEQRKELENDSEKMWLLGMIGAITVHHRPKVLEIFVAGKYAKAMEALAEDKVFNHTVENLHRFLDKKYNVTTPIAFLRTQWFTNPHFRGAYSYRSVETHRQRIYADLLEEALGERNIVRTFLKDIILILNHHVQLCM